MVQTPPPTGLVRGVLVANEPGDFVVQPKPGLQYHYRADGKTWIEREEERVRISDLRPGEILEVVSDRDSQEVRYARLVHVLPRARPERRNLHQSPSGETSDAQMSVFTGIVSNRRQKYLTLRTRLDGEIVMSLRDDTHLLNGGQDADVSELTANTHVFIRAARNHAKELEAIEIIWGSVLLPNPDQKKD